ncbi:MAG TPA: hypothetical protein VGJ57_07785 [Nitrospirales bacterium]
MEDNRQTNYPDTQGAMKENSEVADNSLREETRLDTPGCRREDSSARLDKRNLDTDRLVKVEDRLHSEEGLALDYSGNSADTPVQAGSRRPSRAAGIPDR